MNQKSGGLGCAAMCWGVALLGGVLVAVLLMALAGYAFVAAAFLGLVALVIGGLILTWALCRPLPGPNEAVVEPGQTDAVSTKPAATSTHAATVAAAGGAGAAATAASVMPSKALSGEADLSTRKGAWKYDGKQGEAKKPAAKKPAAKKAAEKKPAAKKAAAKSTTAKSTSAKSTSAKSTAAKSSSSKSAGSTTPSKAASSTASKSAKKPVAKDGKPETLKKPKGGKADDLKMIKGVGPGLEKTLNEMGFWHFDQVAGWRKKEVEWVDERLKFKGRIERDEWIKQAKTLAKGGQTEFSKRAKY